MKKDSKRAWLICTIAFLVNFVRGGISYTYGLLLLGLIKDLQYSTFLLSLAGSLYVGCLHGLSVIVGPLASVFGCHKVAFVGGTIGALGLLAPCFTEDIYVITVCYGFLGGAGTSCLYISSQIAVNNSFEKHKSLASTISRSGTPLGPLINSPLTTYLIVHFSWKYVLVLDASLMLTCALLCLTMPSQENNENKSVMKELRIIFCNENIMRQPAFWIFQVAVLIGAGPLYAFLIYIPLFLTQKKGQDDINVAWMMSIMALAGGISRPFTGFIHEKIKISAVSMGGLGGILQFASVLVMIFGWEFYHFTLGAIMFALGLSPKAALAVIASYEVTSKEYGNYAYCWAETFFGVFGAFIPPLLAYLENMDENITQTTKLYIVCALFAVSSVGYFIASKSR